MPGGRREARHRDEQLVDTCWHCCISCHQNPIAVIFIYQTPLGAAARLANVIQHHHSTLDVVHHQPIMPLCAIGVVHYDSVLTSSVFFAWCALRMFTGVLFFAL